jgi:predicted ATPase
MREAFLPGNNGEDLVTCLYWMREASPDRFEVIEDTLRAAFPAFDRLNFPPVASGLLALTWKEKEVKQPFFLHQLSEGTLRFLWLITLLYSPGLTEVTLLDEPEVSLHPELLSVLADCLRDASNRTQLIVATHADRLVRFLRPEEVVTFELEDSVSTVTRAENLDLESWLKEYTLDQIWEHGRMGGRP